MRHTALVACLLSLTWTGCAKGPAVSPEQDGSAALHGDRLLHTALVPSFQATATDGSTRTKADLMGHPTVIWFYPAADTPG